MAKLYKPSQNLSYSTDIEQIPKYKELQKTLKTLKTLEKKGEKIRSDTHKRRCKNDSKRKRKMAQC